MWRERGAEMCQRWEMCAPARYFFSFFFIIVLLQPFYFAESAPLILLMPAFLLSSVCECRYAWRHARAHRARVYFGKLSLGFFSPPRLFVFFCSVQAASHCCNSFIIILPFFFSKGEGLMQAEFFFFRSAPLLIISHANNDQYYISWPTLNLHSSAQASKGV